MKKRKSTRWGLRLAVSALLLSALLLALAGTYRFFFRREYPREYAQLVAKYADMYGVDENLVYAVIKTESDFRPDVVSVNDACGLMQLLPDTLTWLQTLTPEKDSCVREDLFEPEVNIHYGVFFLSWLLQKFPEQDTAAAAYHAGSGAVERWLNNELYSADGIRLSAIPYSDTAAYVRRIRQCYTAYCNLYGDALTQSGR